MITSDATPNPRRIDCKVTGVAAVDRCFFGGRVQMHLLEHEAIDLRIDWSGGDNGTENMKVVVDCCEFIFPSIREAIIAALDGTYLACPLVAPKHDLSKVAA